MELYVGFDRISRQTLQKRWRVQPGPGPVRPQLGPDYVSSCRPQITSAGHRGLPQGIVGSTSLGFDGWVAILPEFFNYANTLRNSLLSDPMLVAWLNSVAASPSLGHCAGPCWCSTRNGCFAWFSSSTPFRELKRRPNPIPGPRDYRPRTLSRKCIPEPWWSNHVVLVPYVLHIWLLFGMHSARRYTKNGSQSVIVTCCNRMLFIGFIIHRCPELRLVGISFGSYRWYNGRCWS
jgi:hypothetical protein